MPWKEVTPEKQRAAQAIVDRYALLGDRMDENRLAVYNAERARGLVHTPEWVAKMDEIQARLDARATELREVWD